MHLKLITTAIFICLLFCFSVSAQQQHCFTTEKYNELVKQHPEILQVQEQLEQFTQQFTANRAQQRTTDQIYIIPLVFHIIHNYGPEDISDAQVIDEVRILNLDYRKLDYDTAAVIPIFKPIAADCGIEFRLANIDPNGNCTNGIDRVVSTLTYNADDNSKLNDWPPDQYLNIWVVNGLADAAAAAYAYYPGTVSPDIDGVLVRYDYVGSIGASSLYTSRTVTHEIGHCLNLWHPWGNTNQPGVACGDDHVTDTPITEGWTTCDLSGAVCNPSIIENVQNYMDYSYCTCMFTQGQKTRMLAALNSNVSERNNLWSSSNAIATGINNATPNTCAPIADFTSASAFACTNQAVTFNNLSWNGQATSWNWNFPGGSPSVSNDSMPVVYYSSPGVYNATLSVSNANGSNSVTKDAMVNVGATYATGVPYYQSFEDASSFPGNDGYIIINPDGGETWERTTDAGSSGTASIMINNYEGTASGQIDAYITQAFDLTYITGPILTFKVANAQGSSTSEDRLKVYVTTDCGITWNVKYNKAGAALATAGVVESDFIPNSSQWRTETINLSLFAGSPDVRIKFENTSGAGNNTYIDEINITGTVGINELNLASLYFDMYPNPSHEESVISFELTKESDTQIRVVDMMGREVSEITDTHLNAGSQQFSINSNNLAKGVYFVELVIDGSHAVRKLILD